MKDELPLDLVRTLLAVVDEGTFDAAAAALHVTPPAVSQRVKALEQRVGRVLVTRGKPARPTESGEVLVRLGRQLTRLERDARAELGLGAGSPADGDGDDAPPPALLPIAVNSDSLATWLLPALTDLPPGAPPVCFELRREDQDHTTALLREGAVMAAVTSSPDPVSGCSVRPLGAMRYHAVAAPEFAARHFGGGAPSPALLRERLPRLPVVVFDRRDDLQDAFVRGLRRSGAGASAHRHFVPSSEGYAASVAAGLGWGMLPEAQSEPLVRSGELVLLAPGRPTDVPLYWQQWKLDSPALAAVARSVAGAAAASLIQPR